MKEVLAEIVQNARTPLDARNLVREYLQARILGGMQNAGAMIPLAFHGGTALRFLFSSARFSEDLDFALEIKKELYNFRGYLRSIESEFRAEGYAIAFKVSDHKTVHSAFVRFPGLLFELGLSPHRNEVIAVKIEVDTNPPTGAGLATTVIRRYVPLHLQHHDRASLFAGKLHALLHRPFLKGRDLYDLFWYLSHPDWPSPNLTLLNNALQQTGWTGPVLDENSWRDAVRKRLESADWQTALNDVRPFLASPAELSFLTYDHLIQLLGKR